MIRQMLISLIKIYRLFLSPWLGTSCRFEPTCSLFAIEALSSHDTVKGSYLIMRRVARCHPWCDGGYDPVPLYSSTLNSWPFSSRSSSKSA